MTGASSGLGLQLARVLGARCGANLILTARRAAPLEALKAELVGKAQVEVLPGDLSDIEEVDRVVQALAPRRLRAAVLNAGVTYMGPHRELSWSEFDAMLRLNVTGTIRLTNHLIARGSENPLRIMLVASMAGLSPVPFQAAYSGTKAFLVAFATAVAQESEGSLTSLCVFAPGGIATEMTAGEKFTLLRRWLAPVDEVTEAALGALRGNRLLYVPGAVNNLGLILQRFLPRGWFAAQVGREYRKALDAVADSHQKTAPLPIVPRDQ